MTLLHLSIKTSESMREALQELLRGGHNNGGGSNREKCGGKWNRSSLPAGLKAVNETDCNYFSYLIPEAGLNPIPKNPGIP